MSALFNNPESNPPEEPTNAITRLFEETESRRQPDKEPAGAEEEEKWEDVEDEPEEDLEEEEGELEEKEEEEEESEEEEAEDSEEDEEEDEDDELDYEAIKEVKVKVGNKDQKVSDLVNSYQHLQREHTRVSQERSKMQKEMQDLQSLQEPANNYQEFQEALNQIPELRSKFMQIFTDSQIQQKLQEFQKNRPQPEKPQPQQTQTEPQQPQEPDPELEQKAQEAIDQFKEVHGDNYDLQKIIETANQINAPVSYDGLKQALAVTYADELLEKASAPKTKADSSKKKKRLKPKRPAKPPAPEPELDEGDEILALAKKRQLGPFS